MALTDELFTSMFEGSRPPPVGHPRQGSRSNVNIVEHCGGSRGVYGEGGAGAGAGAKVIISLEQLLNWHFRGSRQPPLANWVQHCCTGQQLHAPTGEKKQAFKQCEEEGGTGGGEAVEKVLILNQAKANKCSQAISCA